MKTLSLSTLAALFCSATLASPTVIAKDSADLSFFEQEIPIVLSATRLAQPQNEAPATVSIIDRELIKLSGAKNIPEIFRLVPGMHVGYFRGNNPVVAYQGLSSEYPQGVQVLIDGRSVYSPLFGGVDWANLPLLIEDIERIEIIRGANGSSFGSNAFQSVINISTSHSVQSNGLQVKSILGEHGYQRSVLRAGGGSEDMNFRIGASHIDDSGYRNNHDDNRQDTINARIDYQLSANDSLQLNIGAVNSLRQTKNPKQTPDPFDPARQVESSNYSAHIKWEKQTADRQQFITQFSYTQHQQTDKVSSVFDSGIPGVGDVSSQLDYSQYYERYDLEFEHQFEASEALRISWGIGNRNDRVYIPLWLGSDKTFDNSLQRIFSNIEWRPFRQVVVNLGALWEQNLLSGDGLSPRIAVNYLPSKQHSFRLSASHSTRVPVLTEEHFHVDLALESVSVPGLLFTQPVGRSTHELEAEKVDSFELGYHGLFINNALSLDLKLFRNEYDQLIDTRDIDTPLSISLDGKPLAPFTIDAGNKIKLFDNLYYANINGYEFELNYRPNKNNLVHIGYAYNHVNVGGLNNKDIRNIQRSVPKDIFNMLLAHTFNNGLWLSTALYYTGSMEYLDSGNPQGPMRRLDLNIGQAIKLAAGQNLDLSFSLQLALDKNKDFLNEFHLDNRAFIEANYSFE
ncbi:outer membrane receptor protein [Cycloclasticus sp. 46_120_T64]|nr:outer membrane receptor protein [Cycloclasticus sp. 46_120_T64]